ncbi:solute carrier organic anion transporter family member 4A1-like [Lepeophtheirus salmonis]|uniref:solute carrier organic anion transporter family member 4A1-like n=1 Tax=Lepeophtheirus salmonis TaxID=72036 RepID=UPI003AF3F733
MAAISKQERTGVDNECFQETDMDVEKKLPFNSCLKDAEMISDPQSNNNTSDKLHRVLGIRLHGSLLGPKWLLTFLCMAALVQGMIFTNVVISSLEKRFGLQSTTSGIIAGAYDMGSLIAVIPVTYFGGRPGASKPKYIAWGMFIVDTFIPWEINSTKSGKGYSDVLCHSGEEEESLVNTTFSNLLPGSFERQLLHGIGSAALITLGTTLLDGSVKKSSVPLYIGILNACFVIGPAFG